MSRDLTQKLQAQQKTMSRQQKRISELETALAQLSAQIGRGKGNTRLFEMARGFVKKFGLEVLEKFERKVEL